MILFCCGGLVLFPSASSFCQLPPSKHFRIETLADGVYAVIASEQGYAVCNAGIIDLGDKTLVFDTFISPEAADDLKNAAEGLTRRSVAYVVNSHYHNDHIRGNQVFPSATDIISTARTRELVAKLEPEEIKWEVENVPQRIRSTQEEIEREKVPEKRRELWSWLVYYQAIQESHPQLKMRLPSITFEQKLILRGPRRTVELLTFGRGHTESDAVLYLPEEKIVFMGDLLFVNFHPYLPDGFPDEWKQVLEKIEALGAETFVPGHGPPGRRNDLQLMRQYIDSLQTIAGTMVRGGEPIDAASSKAVPAQFGTWWFSKFFVPNLKFLYETVAAAQKK